MQHPMIAIAVLACAAGCGLLEPDSRRVVGLIHDGSVFTVPTIEAPDTVRQGVAFSATINTLGSSGCHTPDGVRLLSSGPSEVRVVPYDRVPTNTPCTPDMRPIPHPVELHFTEAGAATIVAEGKVAQPSGGLARGTVAKAVIVVP
jgi:hypothetical protein